MSAENNTGASLENPAAPGGSAETKGKGKSLATDNVEDTSMAVDDDDEDDDKEEESDEVSSRIHPLPLRGPVWRIH